jgi:hypothetical protein
VRRPWPRFLLAAVVLVIVAEIAVIFPDPRVLILAAAPLWMAWPGVTLARRALAAGDPSGCWARLVGPAFGLAFSVLGVFACWAVGVTSWIAIVVGPGLTWLLAAVARRFGGPTLRLPAFDRRDAAAIACVLAIVPVVTWAPYDHVGEKLPDGEAYRAYFTADFVWAMTVTGELAKGQVPPRNPYLNDQKLHYYWLAHFLSGSVYRTVRTWGVAKEPVILVDGLAFGLAFVAFLYALARTAGGGPVASAIAVAAGFLANSFEGTDMLRSLIAHGQPLSGVKSVNIDATTRWFHQGMAVDGLQRLLLYQPHHLTGYMTGLAALWLVGLAEDIRETSVALWAGVLLGVTLLFSTFAALIIGAAVGLVFAWRLAQQRAWRAIVPSLILGAAPAASGAALTSMLAYTDQRYGSLLLLGANPVAFHQAAMVLFLSFGPLLVAVAAAALRWRWSAGPGAAPVALALAAFFFYFFTDVPDTGHVWVGWRSGHMLLIAFAAILAAALSAAWTVRRWRPLLAAVAALALAAGVPTPAIDIYNAQDISNRERGPNFPWTFILTRDEREAVDWIRRSTPEHAVVQTESHVRGSTYWTFIPAFAERRSIAIGAGSMIPERPYREAAEEVRDYIFKAGTAEEAHAFAKDLGVDYLACGRLERRTYGAAIAKIADSPALFERVFRNDEMTIFRVR